MTRSAPHKLSHWRLAAACLALLCSPAVLAQETAEAVPEPESVVDFADTGTDVSTAPSGQPVGDGFTEGAVVVTPGQMEEALGELVREYQRTGRAGILRQSTVMVVPFGHSQPVLACAPLRASVVELQPGEVVLGVVAGDTERFAVEQTVTGPAGRTPLVVVKPLAYDVTTNLVVSTDRRVYHVTLDSAPRPSRAGHERSGARPGEEVNPQPRYARHIRFYYPDDGATGVQTSAASRLPAATPAPQPDAPASLDDLHFGYQVTGDPALVAAVERVFDDGVHAYVKLSRQAVRGGEVPVLYAIGPGGDREVLNYAYRGGYYVTDRAVREAELVLGATVRTGFLGLGGRRQVERSARLLRLD